MRLKLSVVPVIIALMPMLLACSLHSLKVYTIAAQAKFEKHDDSTYLMVSDRKRHCDIFWSYEHSDKKEEHIYPLLLDNNTTYTFTIEAMRHKSKNIDLAYETYELIKVAQNEHVIYDREICEIHHCKMERKEVPVTYGLVMSFGKHPTVEQIGLLFPHHSESVLGGCVVTPESKKTDLIFVCSVCKAAYQKWCSENEKKNE